MKAALCCAGGSDFSKAANWRGKLSHFKKSHQHLAVMTFTLKLNQTLLNAGVQTYVVS